MMEVYRTPSKETQDVLLESVVYSEVIEGLNGYFVSRPRNDYITVFAAFNRQKFVLYEPEAWADILISWLRTKHGVFYYPGIEAKYAKMEKIPPFTERMMDEGAYNSLKALHKRVTGKETSTNCHTLIADNIKYFVNEEESDIKKLKDRIAELESNFKAVCDESDLFKTMAIKAEEEVRNLKVELNAIKDTVSQVRGRLNKKLRLGYEEDLVKLADIAVKAVEVRDISDRIHEICTAKGVELDDAFLYDDDYTWEDLVGFLCEEIRKLKKEVEDSQEASVCKDIMKYIRYEASRNGFELPEEIDDEPLTIKRVFHDLLELMRKRGAEIRGLKSGIEDLKEHITLLEADLKKAKMEKEKFLIEVADREEEIESLQNKDYDVYLEHRRYIINSIMFDIRQEASRNGFSLPEKIDGEQLSIERTFHDLIELLMKRTAEVEEARKKHWNDLRDIHKALGRDGTCDSIDGFAKAVKARAEYVESLSRNAEREAQKSDTNKLIRECCTKHDIVVPSRYLSDEACIEYLFSMVEDYKLKLKDYILKDIEEHGYRYDGLQTKSIEEIVDWIITMATSDHSFIVLKDIYTTVASPAERFRYKDCDEPTVDHMKDYILRRFEGLHANIEYCLKKMSELDQGAAGRLYEAKRETRY